MDYPKLTYADIHQIQMALVTAKVAVEVLQERSEAAGLLTSHYVDWLGEIKKAAELLDDKHCDLSFCQ